VETRGEERVGGFFGGVLGYMRGIGDIRDRPLGLNMEDTYSRKYGASELPCLWLRREMAG
jgi:hypothetical protein